MQRRNQGIELAGAGLLDLHQFFQMDLNSLLRLKCDEPLANMQRSMGMNLTMKVTKHGL